MRILLLTQLFQPEPNHLKGLEFARELVRRGHEVEVLTGFPNYPGGKLYPGYRLKPWMRETMEGIRVTRVLMYPCHDRSAVRRIMGYLSFAFSAAKLGPFLARKPDVVHVYQGPATLAWPAIVFRTVFGAPLVLDVQDLWPESVSSTGMLPLPGAASILALWSKLTYRLARKIVVLSAGYRDGLVLRGVPAEKIEVVHNWCDESAVPGPADAHGEDPYGFRGKFNIVYAGNFGTVQALRSVVEAAALIHESRPEIRFVLIGSGVEETELREMVTRSRLRNVAFIPRQSPVRLKTIMALADVLLVHMKDDPLTRIGIPQKIQAALAAGKPILLAVRGSAADLVQESGAGVICPPENPQEIAAAALRLADIPRERLRAIGENGRAFYREKLSFSLGIDRMADIFESATRIGK